MGAGERLIYLRQTRGGCLHPTRLTQSNRKESNQSEASAERGAVAGRRGGAGRDDEAERRKKPRSPTEAKRAPQLTEGEATAVNPQGRKPEASDARRTRGTNENGGMKDRLKVSDELGGVPLRATL